MKIDLYQQSGEKKGTLDVSDKMFDATVKDELIRLALVRQLSNARQANAHTKTKGEVRGGGRKPWKQKGTGRARAGSSRSPIWKGGGVIFGPRSNRNYEKDMPKKARRLAMFGGLSQKAKGNHVMALEDFKVKTPKTKEFVSLMKKLPMKRSLLVVLAEKNPMIEKCVANIPNAKTILVDYLNLFDILKFEKIIFLAPALKKAEELFL